MYVGVALYWVASSFDEPESAACVKPLTAGLKCRSQVTGQVTGYRPQARSQVRPQVRSQVRSQLVTHKNNRTLDKPVLDWHFIIQSKTSQGTSIIFFLFWTLPNPTHEKIYSCLSGKEDLRYSVTKVGNEITKVRKITWFVRKTNLKTKGCCVKNIMTCLWIFWKAFDDKTEEKRKDTLKLIWPLKYGNFLQTFLVVNSSCRLCIKVGRGQGDGAHRDACVGTWDLRTRDEGLEDIKYGTWGLGTVTRGRQKQGRRGRGMWMIIAKVGGKCDISFFVKMCYLWSTLDSIFQNHIGHLMMFTQNNSL